MRFRAAMFDGHYITPTYSYRFNASDKLQFRALAYAIYANAYRAARYRKAKSRRHRMRQRRQYLPRLRCRVSLRSDARAVLATMPFHMRGALAASSPPRQQE